jgi:D-glycero-alpha-D-manno-heptose-7-phosphate kinase
VNDERGISVPRRVIKAVAPIRVCDVGGWTDTWFAGHGKVFNIAVFPCVEVQVTQHPSDAVQERVVLDIENYGERYAFEPGHLPGRHPLLEAAVEEVGLPPGVSVEISISSKAPAGSSTGTSASTLVALIGGLDALLGGRMKAQAVAAAAHHIEVDRLGRQSGVQDQICAAYGGINFIEIVSYPHVVVSQLSVPDRVRMELEKRLSLLYLGRSHESSTIHDRVIAKLSSENQTSLDHLDDLRRSAERAKDAMLAGDFAALGLTMKENTDIQGGLHADLISNEAQTVIDVAAAHGALGWKVNGAGGEGGSITLLSGPDMRSKRAMLRAIGEANPSFQAIPSRLSPAGLRVWQA